MTHCDPRVGNCDNDHGTNQRAQYIGKDNFTENPRTHERRRRLENMKKQDEK